MHVNNISKHTCENNHKPAVQNILDSKQDTVSLCETGDQDIIHVQT